LVILSLSKHLFPKSPRSILSQMQTQSAQPSIHFLGETPEPPFVTQSEGECPLQIQQIDKIHADETWKREGSWQNIFYVPVRLTNSSDKPVTIIDITSSYVNQGETVDATAALGDGNWYTNYSTWRRPYACVVEPESVETLTLIGQIKISGFPQIDKARRVHSSLPHPLVLTFKLKDSLEHTRSFTVTIVSPPLNPVTRATKEKDNSVKYDWWMQCDDTNAMERLWIAMIKKDDHLEISRSGGNGKYLYRNDILKGVYKAIKDKKTEVEIEDFKEDKDAIQVRAYVVVDLEANCGYAIRFSMKTSTSSLDTYRVLPYKL